MQCRLTSAILSSRRPSWYRLNIFANCHIGTWDAVCSVGTLD
jgi:hypothetical protein